MNTSQAIGLRAQWGRYRGTRGNVSFPATLAIGIGMAAVVARSSALRLRGLWPRRTALSASGLHSILYRNQTTT